MKFDRAFRLFVHGTALWSFMALVSTGQLHLPAVVVILPLLLLPMLGVARRVQLSPYIWSFLTLLAFLAAFLNMLVMHEIMYSLVYFFLFLEITKLWTLRQNRDVFQVLILSFFQMVAASVMTASLGFAVMFIGYSFLLTVTSMLFSIKREADDVVSGKWVRRRKRRGAKARPSPVPILGQEDNGSGVIDRSRLVTWSFLNGAVWLTFIVVLGTGGIFLMIPRFSSQRLLSGFSLMRPQKTSGFSDRVDFESFGNIQLDPTVIGRVQAKPIGGAGQAPPSLLRLRGTALDYYTGRQWRKSRTAYGRLSPQTVIDIGVRQAAPDGSYLRQDIILEPDGSNYLFGASMPLRFTFNQTLPVTFDRMNLSLTTTRRESSFRYVVDSLMPDEIKEDPALSLPDQSQPIENMAKDLAIKSREFGQRIADEMLTSFLTRRRSWSHEGRRSPWAQALRRWAWRTREALRDQMRTVKTDVPVPRLQSEMRYLFTQIPDVQDMDSVMETAVEWTKGYTTPWSKADRIEHLLQTRFTYTTDIQVSDPEFHMTEFLRESQRGHCEYFASAMTLMLRSLGIPARIVTGYLTDDFNEAGGYFMVRRQHAHSWVEAWIAPDGWITFDPSPPSGVRAGRTHAGGFLAGVQSYLDALRFHWYRHVIDFDIQDQFQMARSASSWRTRMSGIVNDFLKPLRDTQRAIALRSQGISPGRTLAVIVLALVGSVVAWLLGRELLAVWLRRSPRTGKRAEQAVRHQVAYYLEILQTLAAFNYRRRTGQTPWEFASDVVQARTDWIDLIPVTEAYYHARFRSAEVTEQDLERAHNLVERIRSTNSR